MLAKHNRIQRRVTKRNVRKDKYVKTFRKGSTMKQGVHNCSDKLRFKTEEQALEASLTLTDRLALTAAPILPYRCGQHDCWHIGHDRTRR